MQMAGERELRIALAAAPQHADRFIEVVQKQSTRIARLGGGVTVAANHDITGAPPAGVFNWRIRVDHAACYGAINRIKFSDTYDSAPKNVERMNSAGAAEPETARG